MSVYCSPSSISAPASPPSAPADCQREDDRARIGNAGTIRRHRVEPDGAQPQPEYCLRQQHRHDDGNHDRQRKPDVERKRVVVRQQRQLGLVGDFERLGQRR